MFNWFVYEDLTVAQICSRLEKKKVKNPTFSLIDKVPTKPAPKRASKWPYFWNDRTVRDKLKDELYIGNFYYNKTRRIPDPNNPSKKIQIDLAKKDWTLSEVKHAPLIDQETFDLAQRKFTQLSHMPTTTRSEESSYLLSGLLFCDTCKDYEQRRNGMVTRVGNKWWKSQQMYMCKGKASSNKKRCPCMPLPKEWLEKRIILRVKSLFKNPQIIREYLEKSNYVKGKSTMIEQELNDNLAHQQQLSEQMDKLDEIVKVSVQYPIERYDQEKKELEGLLISLKYKEKDLREELSEHVEIEKYERSLEVFGDHLRKKWKGVFEDRKKLRTLLKLLIKKIVIYSKAKPKDYVVPWPKKKGQRIASNISIHFRLPQEMLDGLYKQVTLQEWESKNDLQKRLHSFDQGFITEPENTIRVDTTKPWDYKKAEKKLKEMWEKLTRIDDMPQNEVGE